MPVFDAVDRIIAQYASRWPKLAKLVAEHLDINVEVTVDFALTEIVAELYHAGAPADLAQPDIAGRLLKRGLED